MIETWACAIAILGTILIGCLSTAAAYRNGVNDGYMFSKDPTCPGYFKARRILERFGKLPTDESE